MNARSFARKSALLEGAPSLSRDPLQVPTRLRFDEARPLARGNDLVWSVSVGVLVGAAAVAALLLGTATSDLDAAAPNDSGPAISEPAPSPGGVREWYLPDVLFNAKAETAQSVDTF